MIDIGCAEGTFLYILKKVFKNANLYGCEPNKAFAQYASDLIPEAKIHNGMFNSEYFDLDFEIICASHILKHVLNPKDFLYHCGKILDDNGMIFVEVPVGEREPGNYFHLAHLHYFTTKSLQK